MELTYAQEWETGLLGFFTTQLLIYPPMETSVYKTSKNISDREKLGLMKLYPQIWNIKLLNWRNLLAEWFKLSGPGSSE